MDLVRNSNVAQQLTAWAETIFQTIADTRTKFAGILDDCVLESGQFRVSSPARKRLAQVARQHVAECSQTDGVGLIFQRQLVVPESPALEWWIREGDQLRRQGFVNDPSSPLFYDYEQLEWFRGGFGAEARTLAGPYIDHFGVQDYITTWTIPLVIKNRTVGVVGLDLKVDALEKVLVPKLLKASNGRAALVNETGQVIVSTIGPFSSGTLVETAPSGYAFHPLQVENLRLTLLVEAG